MKFQKSEKNIQERKTKFQIVMQNFSGKLLKSIRIKTKKENDVKNN